MARDRDGRGTRYYEEDPEEERRHRRRHKSRENDDEPSAARRERRERRRAEEARGQAEVDIDDLRSRRASYFARPEAERPRDRERMVQEIRLESAQDQPRSSHRELRRDGSRRVKRREVVADDRSDDFVYGRPKSHGAVDEISSRRLSARKRSDEGGSSSRTAFTPHSGSGSASLRRVEEPKLSRQDDSHQDPQCLLTVPRTTSAREPSRGFMSTRPSVRRTSAVKSPPPPSPITRTQSVRDTARKSTGGILSSFFRPLPPRTPTAAVHKEVTRFVNHLHICPA